MTWFRVDDRAANHPKARRLRGDGSEATQAKSELGAAAFGYWAAAGAYAGQNLTDGFIADEEIAYVMEGLGLELAAKYCRILVEARLFDRDDQHKGFRLHDYLACNPTRESTLINRDQDNRRKAIARNSKLQTEVRERDGARCRYCRKRVRWGGKGPTVATYDHVDPRGATVAANIVVACKACNASKGDGAGSWRVPAERIAAVAAELARQYGAAPASSGTEGSGRDGTGRVGTGRDLRRPPARPAGRPPGQMPDTPPLVGTNGFHREEAAQEAPGAPRAARLDRSPSPPEIPSPIVQR